MVCVRECNHLCAYLHECVTLCERERERERRRKRQKTSAREKLFVCVYVRMYVCVVHVCVRVYCHMCKSRMVHLTF